MKTESMYAYNLNFQSASDINLQYILKKHTKYLPKRMINEIQAAIQGGKGEIPFYKLHEDVYKPLLEADSLEKVKSIYPEFSNVIELSDFAGSRSKVIKAVKGKGIPLEDFTLDFLKKIYAPTTQNDIVKEYGFTNRSLVQWLLKKLKIEKLPNVYFNLLNMSNEEENLRIAECSRKAMYARPAQMMEKIYKKIAIHHSTPEYIEKKRREMKDFYERHPEHAKKVGEITRLTWNRCPEIKAAMREYTKSTHSYAKKILTKQKRKEKLTQEEKRYIKGFFKGFWELYPDYKKKFAEEKLKVIKEFN